MQNRNIYLSDGPKRPSKEVWRKTDANGFGSIKNEAYYPMRMGLRIRSLENKPHAES